MSTPSHLLYLLSLAELDEPGAGWATTDDGIANAAGDRVTVTARLHGYTAAIQRHECRVAGVGFAEQLDALWDRMRDADRVPA